MPMTSLLSFLAMLLAQPLPAPAQPAVPGLRAGEVHAITRVADAVYSEEGDYPSSGSSHDRDSWSERVILLRGDGVELEFDLPRDSTAEDRARVWQLPARVLRPPRGPLRLLNGPELEARLTGWLERARWPREICGRHIFTWNVFKIECDPQAVLETLAVIDLAATDLRDGAPYSHPGALAPGTLRREAGALGGAVFVTELTVDPEKAMREHARSQEAVREIMGDNPDTSAARAARTPRRITGTIRVRFETDAAGRFLRRIQVLELLTERVNGTRERRTVTETVERRLVSPPSS
jgi:hypothetical protein